MNQRTALLILAILIVVVSVGVFLAARQQPKQIIDQVSTTPAIQDWKGVIPGETTREDVLQRLGTPLISEEKGTTSVLLYPTNNQHLTNDVEIQNNKVSFIRERLFAPSDLSFKKRVEGLAQPPVVLYGPEASSGQLLYVYPSLGVAFLANQPQDVVFEIWHFPRVTHRQFLSLPQAEGYTTTEQQGGM